MAAIWQSTVIPTTYEFDKISKLQYPLLVVFDSVICYLFHVQICYCNLKPWLQDRIPLTSTVTICFELFTVFKNKAMRCLMKNARVMESVLQEIKKALHVILENYK